MKQSLRIQHWRSQRNNSFFTCDCSFKNINKTKIIHFFILFPPLYRPKTHSHFPELKTQGDNSVRPVHAKSHLANEPFLYTFFFLKIQDFWNFTASELLIKKRQRRNDYHNGKCKNCTVMKFQI